MTEGNETITLHSQSWDRVIETLNEKTERSGNPTPHTIANTIQSQRSEPAERRSQDAIALTGLPGAGKSYVAKKLAQVFGASTISVDDVIRERAPGDVDKEELAGFVPRSWAEIEEKVIAWVCNRASVEDSDLVIVNGVRSLADCQVLRDHFDRFYLIDVDAPFKVRLSRIQWRRCESDEPFDRVDLAKRDEHELQELGQAELRRQYERDLKLKHEGEKFTLRRRLSTLVHEDLPFEPENEKALLPPVGGTSEALAES
jgi:dephospho-CoA kinase